MNNCQIDFMKIIEPAKIMKQMKIPSIIICFLYSLYEKEWCHFFIPVSGISDSFLMWV